MYCLLTAREVSASLGYSQAVGRAVFLLETLGLFLSFPASYAALIPWLMVPFPSSTKPTHNISLTLVLSPYLFL